MSTHSAGSDQKPLLDDPSLYRVLFNPTRPRHCCSTIASIQFPSLVVFVSRAVDSFRQESTIRTGGRTGVSSG